ESLSVQCFHWVLTRMQHDMDMIVSDKKQARIWAKRLHVAIQTFRELLLSLLALQKVKDDRALALFDMLLNNVCYVLEYRETILHLLMNYNEAHSTNCYFVLTLCIVRPKSKSAANIESAKVHPTKEKNIPLPEGSKLGSLDWYASALLNWSWTMLEQRE
ncbi:PREDICTED: protein timeless homolog, partial [Rhagoletis zephyria]|uniref:protein timeless homolog n=1 Tax=Rhagoletis zephyria TaxID=28612 RepID=UPI00081187AE